MGHFTISEQSNAVSFHIYMGMGQFALCASDANRLSVFALSYLLLKYDFVKRSLHKSHSDA